MSWIYVGDYVKYNSLHYNQENFGEKILEGMIVGVFRDKKHPFKTDFAHVKIISYDNDKEYADIHPINNIELSKRNNFLDNNPNLYFLEGFPYKDGVIIYQTTDSERKSENNIYSVQSIELNDSGLQLKLLDIESIDSTARWRQSIINSRMKKTVFKGFDDTMMRDKLLKDYVDKKIIEFYQNPYLNEEVSTNNSEYLTLNIQMKNNCIFL